MTIVVLLLGSERALGAGAALDGERSRLDLLLEESGPVEIRLVSRHDVGVVDGVVEQLSLAGHDVGPLDRVLGALGATRLHDRLARVPIGRLLNSMGPLDQGRVFWRAVRRSPEARALIRGADVAIAGDAAAVKTAWLARRRGLVAAAYYDHRAAGSIRRRARR